MKSERIKSLKNSIAECLNILDIISCRSELEVVSKDEINTIRNLYGELGYYDSAMPRIFLLGEFKAGKSSLVNALLGKNYAPTDILEMTAGISKFWKSENDYCKINYKDATSENTNLQGFLDNYKNRKFEAEYLNKIKSIEFGIKDLDKNYILIDTPGFGSVNYNNEKKLLENIFEADIMLFTIDAESIGSMKEAAIIKEHIKNGIPYIVVITKSDLIANNYELEEIISFIQKEYNAKEDNILSVSVVDSEKNNGLQILEQKLENFVKYFDSNKRQEAELGFLRIISERLLTLLNLLETRLLEIQKRVNTFNSYIDSVSGTISKSIQIDIEEFAKKNLVQNKREQIITEIGSILNSTSGSISGDQIASIFSKILGTDFWDYLDKRIRTEIPIKMRIQWESYSSEIKEKSISIFNGLKLTASSGSSEVSSLTKIGNYDIQIDKLTNKAFSRSMKGTLGVAGVLTAYAAWFGPSAAAVTLPMAFTGVGIPIAVVGAAVSGLLAFKKRNQMKDTMNSSAASILEDVINKVVQDNAMPVISKQIISLNNEFAKSIKNGFYNDNMLGMDRNININKIKQLELALNNK